MENIKDNDFDLSHSDQMAQTMLLALEGYVSDLTNQIKLSGNMLPLGIDTNLTMGLKQMVENPMLHLLQTQSQLNKLILQLVATNAVAFFSKHKDIVRKVFKGLDESYFYIILKDDNYDNRTAVFAFIDDYRSSAIWELVPINFQIIPMSVESKIFIKETIFDA